jgi:hypothetical protein
LSHLTSLIEPPHLASFSLIPSPPLAFCIFYFYSTLSRYLLIYLLSLLVHRKDYRKSELLLCPLFLLEIL